jgi:hypothetical protein
MVAIVLTLIVAIGLAAFCVVAAEWLFDASDGPDAMFVT